MKCSIIIPIFNQSVQLRSCFLHLKLRKEYELILVNDGSTDNSGTICAGYAQKHKNVRYFEQENKGVSAARNLGLRNAKGKYIFFLDADDRLSGKTIKKVCDFFDTVYDEVDLVTYPIETIYKGKLLKPHFRYRYLNKTGVYDLREYPFIGQTTMNVVVKNKFEQNVLFDETMSFSEDQKYCCEVLKDKLKMGFCADGKYIYYRSQNSSSGRMSGACFIFEQCMKMFEDIFSWYGEKEQVPLAFQGLFVNDVYWKLVSNILLPYHYKKEEYEKAVGRIAALLKRCENRVFLEHPAIDFFEKFFLLRVKGKDSLRLCAGAERYSLFNAKTAVLKDSKIELVMTRFRIKGTKVRICGFLKSVAFQFYDKEPTLCVVENGGKLTRKLSLFPSAHCYYQAREATQRFWAFDYELDASEIQKIEFEAEMEGYWYPIKYYFMPRVPFSNFNKSYLYKDTYIEAEVDWDCSILFRMNADAVRKERIWLYYDCKGVPYDNGMLQFNHDMEMEDGVERYYIISDPRQAEHTGAQSHRLIAFGSKEHKDLLFRAEKLLTAYIEENNVLPYGKEEIEKLSPQFHFETVYLQHGVLHIKMPWKYSPEKIMADRVVTSTKQETELFIENGFLDSDIIKAGMPRFDIRNRQADNCDNKKRSEKRRILYAPSWRSYLVGDCIDNVWQPLENKFLTSAYFKKICAFLNSEVLRMLLKEKACVLEVKLHPIMDVYSESIRKAVFRPGSEVNFVKDIGSVREYDLFITDFSSYLYDFLLEKIPILNFIPDINEFCCGMNGYRELNYSDDFWNCVATEPEEIVDKIKQYVEMEKYCPFEADFYDVNDAMDSIYQILVCDDV